MRHDGKSIPEEDSKNIDNRDLRKRQKNIIRCKEAVWRRWQQEYFKALCERHNMKKDPNVTEPAVRDVVVIKGDERNNGTTLSSVRRNSESS